MWNIIYLLYKLFLSASLQFTIPNQRVSFMLLVIFALFTDISQEKYRHIIGIQAWMFGEFEHLLLIITDVLPFYINGKVILLGSMVLMNLKHSELK